MSDSLHPADTETCSTINSPRFVHESVFSIFTGFLPSLPLAHTNVFAILSLFQGLEHLSGLSLHPKLGLSCLEIIYQTHVNYTCVKVLWF